MRSPAISVTTITTPVVEIVDVIGVEVIADGIVVERVVRLIPVFEIVVVEIAVFPLGHVSKAAVGRKMRAAAPVWMIAAVWIVGVIATETGTVVYAAATNIWPVREIAFVKTATKFAGMILRYRSEATAKGALATSSAESAKSMIDSSSATESAIETATSAKSAIETSATAESAIATASEATERASAATATKDVNR